MSVELFVIADRSGSMTSTVIEAVGGFNNFLKDPQTYFTPLLVLAIILLAR